MYTYRLIAAHRLSTYLHNTVLNGGHEGIIIIGTGGAAGAALCQASFTLLGMQDANEVDLHVLMRQCSAWR